MEGKAMLSVGDQVPDFELEDGEGKVWRSVDLRGKKVILYFYPADDTPGCTAQSCDFRDASADLSKAGYIVLGVSPQGAESKQRFAAKYGLNFPLLIDPDLGVTRSFGAFKELGNYKDIPIRINRSTFVIGEDGRLEVVQYGVKARGHVEALRSELGLAS